MWPCTPSDRHQARHAMPSDLFSTLLSDQSSTCPATPLRLLLLSRPSRALTSSSMPCCLAMRSSSYRGVFPSVPEPQPKRALCKFPKTCQGGTYHARRTADAVPLHRNHRSLRDSNGFRFVKNTQNREWTAVDAQNVLRQWHVLAYILVFTLWLLGNVRVLAHAAHGSVVRGLSLGAISGSLAGNMWCTRTLEPSYSRSRSIA